MHSFISNICGASRVAYLSAEREREWGYLCPALSIQHQLHCTNTQTHTTFTNCFSFVKSNWCNPLNVQASPICFFCFPFSSFFVVFSALFSSRLPSFHGNSVLIPFNHRLAIHFRFPLPIIPKGKIIFAISTAHTHTHQHQPNFHQHSFFTFIFLYHHRICFTLFSLSRTSFNYSHPQYFAIPLLLLCCTMHVSCHFLRSFICTFYWIIFIDVDEEKGAKCRNFLMIALSV